MEPRYYAVYQVHTVYTLYCKVHDIHFSNQITRNIAEKSNIIHACYRRVHMLCVFNTYCIYLKYIMPRQKTKENHDNVQQLRSINSSP